MTTTKHYVLHHFPEFSKFKEEKLERELQNRDSFLFQQVVKNVRECLPILTAGWTDTHIQSQLLKNDFAKKLNEAHVLRKSIKNRITKECLWYCMEKCIAFNNVEKANVESRIRMLDFDRDTILQVIDRYDREIDRIVLKEQWNVIQSLISCDRGSVAYAKTQIARIQQKNTYYTSELLKSLIVNEGKWDMITVADLNKWIPILEKDILFQKKKYGIERCRSFVLILSNGVRPNYKESFLWKTNQLCYDLMQEEYNKLKNERTIPDLKQPMVRVHLNDRHELKTHMQWVLTQYYCTLAQWKACFEIGEGQKIPVDLPLWVFPRHMTAVDAALHLKISGKGNNNAWSFIGVLTMENLSSLPHRLSINNNKNEVLNQVLKEIESRLPDVGHSSSYASLKNNVFTASQPQVNHPPVQAAVVVQPSQVYQTGKDAMNSAISGAKTLGKGAKTVGNGVINATKGTIVSAASALNNLFKRHLARPKDAEESAAAAAAAAAAVSVANVEEARLKEEEEKMKATKAAEDEVLRQVKEQELERKKKLRSAGVKFELKLPKNDNQVKKQGSMLGFPLKSIQNQAVSVETMEKRILTYFNTVLSKVSNPGKEMDVKEFGFPPAVGYKKEIYEEMKKKFINTTVTHWDEILEYAKTNVSPSQEKEPAAVSEAVVESEPVAEPVVEPAVSEPVAEPEVEPVVEPAVEPVAEPVVEPVVSEPVAEPEVEPVVEPAVEPVAEPEVEPVVEPAVSEPVAEQVVEPGVEPAVSKPVAEEAVEPAVSETVIESEPVAEEVVEPVSGTVAEETSVKTAQNVEIGDTVTYKYGKNTTKQGIVSKLNRKSILVKDNPSSVDPNNVKRIDILSINGVPVSTTEQEEPVAEPETEALVEETVKEVTETTEENTTEKKEAENPGTTSSEFTLDELIKMFHLKRKNGKKFVNVNTLRTRVNTILEKIQEEDALIPEKGRTYTDSGTVKKIGMNYGLPGKGLSTGDYNNALQNICLNWNKLKKTPLISSEISSHYPESDDALSSDDESVSSTDYDDVSVAESGYDSSGYTSGSVYPPSSPSSAGGRTIATIPPLDLTNVSSPPNQEKVSYTRALFEPLFESNETNFEIVLKSMNEKITKEIRQEILTDNHLIEKLKFEKGVRVVENELNSIVSIPVADAFEETHQVFSKRGVENLDLQDHIVSCFNNYGVNEKLVSIQHWNQWKSMITNDSELVQRMKLNGIHLSQDKKRLVIVDDIVDNLSVVSSVVNDVYENDTDEECEIKQRKEMNTLENEATIHEVKLDDSLSVVSESDEYPSSIHSKSMYGSSSQYDTVENSDSHSESQATSIEEIKVSFDGQLTQIERLIDQGIDVPAQEKLLKKLKEISEKSSLREGIDTLNQKQNIDNLLVKCQKYKENEKKNVLDELEAVRQFIVAEESNDSKIKIESNQTLIQTLSKTVSPPLNIVDMSGNELKVGSLINVRDESDQEPITYVLKRIVTEWDDQVQSYMLRSTSKDERSLYFVPVSSEIMSVPPDLQIEEIEPGVYGCAAEFVGNGDRF